MFPCGSFELLLGRHPLIMAEFADGRLSPRQASEADHRLLGAPAGPGGAALLAAPAAAAAGSGAASPGQGYGGFGGGLPGAPPPPHTSPHPIPGNYFQGQDLPTLIAHLQTLGALQARLPKPPRLPPQGWGLPPAVPPPVAPPPPGYAGIGWTRP